MKRKVELVVLSDNVTAEMEIDVEGSDEMDTNVHIEGDWWIEGRKRKEFCEKLAALIEKVGKVMDLLKKEGF